MGGLVDAHGPDAHGRRRLGVQARHGSDAVFVYTADVLGGLGVIVGHQRAQLVDAVGVRSDVVPVLQPFLEDHMQHGIDQHAVGARGDRQVDIGELRQHGHPRIDHDQRELAFLQRLLQAPVDDRVLLRQVGAEGHQAVSVLEIVVAAGRAVAAETALVAGHRRGHAQGGVAVVVVGADLPAHQLAEGVELLGEQLAGGDHGEGVTAVFGLDVLDLRRGCVQRGIPVCRLEWQMGLVAGQRHRTAPGRLEQFVLQQPLDAQFAAIDVCTGMAAAGDDATILAEAQLDGAAGRAVVAGGVLPFLDRFGRNADGLALSATEDHVLSVLYRQRPAPAANQQMIGHAVGDLHWFRGAALIVDPSTARKSPGVSRRQGQ